MKQETINRKVILIKAGLTESEVARRLGVKPQAVNNEVRGDCKSRRIREYLCEITQTTPEEFWPEFQGEKTNDGEAA